MAVVLKSIVLLCMAVSVMPCQEHSNCSACLSDPGCLMAELKTEIKCIGLNQHKNAVAVIRSEKFCGKMKHFFSSEKVEKMMKMMATEVHSVGINDSVPTAPPEKAKPNGTKIGDLSVKPGQQDIPLDSAPTSTTKPVNLSMTPTPSKKPEKSSKTQKEQAVKNEMGWNPYQWKVPTDFDCEKDTAPQKLERSMCRQSIIMNRIGVDKLGIEMKALYYLNAYLISPSHCEYLLEKRQKCNSNSKSPSLIHKS